MPAKEDDEADSEDTEIDEEYLQLGFLIAPEANRHFFSTSLQFQDYFQVDKDLITSEEHFKDSTSDDFIKPDIDDDVSESSLEVETPAISTKQAIDATLLLLQHSSQNGYSSLSVTLTNHLNDLVFKSTNGKKQSSITNYFEVLSSKT